MVKKATRILRFVSAVEDQPVVVDLDVHKKIYSVSLFSKEDGLVESCTCPSGEDALAHQLTELGINSEHDVYESGPTGFALSRVLANAGFDVSVIAASRIPRGYASAAKNDRLAAVKLATYYARGLLRPIAVPTVKHDGYRALVRRRKRIAESRTRIRPVGQKRLRGNWVKRHGNGHGTPESKELYNRLFAKHGIRQKAIVAVARKLAIKLWRLAVDPPPSSMEDAASGVRSA